MPELRRTIVHRYRVLSRLGEGGMGEVYEVLDAISGRTLALKIMKDPRAGRAIEEEFETLRRVGTHPAFASVYEFGIADGGRPFFTMERIRGLDLARWAAAQGGAAGPIARLFARLAAALEFLHGRGIVHGDLKPANVVVEADSLGEPPYKILDFGLARAVGLDRMDRSVSGTLSYLAPEVLRGGPHSPASDLYALGVLLYQGIAGHPPFDSPSLRTVVRAHLEVPPPPLPGATPSELARIVRSLLAKDPGARPAGAHEVGARLVEWLGEDPTPGPERPDNVRVYLGSARLVGRERELARLVDLGRRLQSTRRFRRERRIPLRMVLLSGEMGSGKTRLLHEDRHQLQRSGVLAFLVRFHEADAYALDPLSRIVSSLVEYLEEADPATVRRHGTALLRIVPQLAGRESLAGLDAAEPLRPPEERARFFHTVLAFLKDVLAAGREVDPPIRSIAILLDDLGLAAPSVFEFLHYLLENTGEARIQTIAAYRTDRGGGPCYGPARDSVLALAAAVERDERSARIALESLSGAAVASLLADSLGQGPGLEGLARSLAEHGHNLFVLEETLVALAREGRLVRERGRWRFEEDARPLPVPEGLAAAIDRHLAGFDPAERRVLEAASAFGREFELAHLAEVVEANDAELRLVVRRLVGSSNLLIRTDAGGGERYDFVGPGVRDHVYARLEPAAAAGWHGRIASVLDSLPGEARGGLAYHLSRVAPSPRGLAVVLEESSARVERHRYLEAADLLERALAMARALGDREGELETRRRLGEALGLAGRTGEALRELEGVRDLLPRGLGRAGVERSIGRYRLRASDLPGALASFESALAQVDPLAEPLLAASLLREAAEVLSRQARWDEATALAARALDLARATPSSKEKERELGDAHDLCGTILYRQGRFDRAGVCYAESLEHRERAGDRLGVSHGLHNQALLLRARGDLPGAAEKIRAALEPARELRDVLGMAAGYDTLGTIHLEQGHLAEAERSFRSAIDLAREARDASGVARATHHLGDLRFEEGRLDEAQELSFEAYRSLQRIGETWLTAESLEDFGRIALARGEFGRAGRLYHRALRKARREGDPAGRASARIGLAEVALLAAELPAAARHLATARRALAGASNPALLGRTLALLARVHLLALSAGRPKSLSTAAALAEEALAASGPVEFLEVRAAARSARALVLAASGEVEEAQSEAEEALALRKRTNAALSTARGERDLAVVSAARGPDWDDRTEEAFERARRAFEAIGAPAELAWTDLAYARFLAEAGAQDEAATHAERAAAAFERLGAPRAAAWARGI